MSTKSLIRTSERMPAVFDDFFKPWNEWFGNNENIWGRILTVPAVNISENKDTYNVSLAVPGKKKKDFKIDVQGDLLTISAESEELKEEKDEKFTRKEYNFSSFSRSFTLPQEVNKEKIEANYEDGVLKLILPKSENKKITGTKQILVK